MAVPSLRWPPHPTVSKQQFRPFTSHPPKTYHPFVPTFNRNELQDVQSENVGQQLFPQSVWATYGALPQPPPPQTVTDDINPDRRRSKPVII